MVAPIWDCTNGFAQILWNNRYTLEDDSHLTFFFQTQFVEIQGYAANRCPRACIEEKYADALDETQRIAVLSRFKTDPCYTRVDQFLVNVDGWQKSQIFTSIMGRETETYTGLARSVDTHSNVHNSIMPKLIDLKF